MILHERAELSVVTLDRHGQEVQFVVIGSLPVELSPQRTDVDPTTGAFSTFYTVYGRRDVALTTEHSFTIRGRRYRVNGPMEKHYVRGRFHHWEVVCELPAG